MPITRPIRFPFLMVADPELKTFQAYRAYDSFEQIALHATFLIDGAGLCRWQDVGFELFRDVDFVLTESKRLLRQPVAARDRGSRYSGLTPCREVRACGLAYPSVDNIRRTAPPRNSGTAWRE